MANPLIVKTLLLCAGLIAAGTTVAPVVVGNTAEEVGEADGGQDGAEEILGADLPDREPGEVVAVEDDPAETAVPAAVSVVLTLAVLAATVWGMLTPAGALGWPCVWVGAAVAVLAVFAYALGVADAWEVGVGGRTLAAWLSVAACLVVAGLIVLLSYPTANTAVAE